VHTPTWHWFLGLAAVAGLAGVLGGCAAPTAAHGTTPKPSNGDILSKTPLPAYGSNNATVYRLFYECNGARVEAYLTVPKGSRHDPLVVYLHGGSASGKSLPGAGYSAAEVATLASPSYVELFPEYQGYQQSSGDVKGLYTDAVDTLVAVRAAESVTSIDPHRLYLIGVSLGGGVALKVAGMLQGVRAVIGLSPYVGLRTFVRWATNNSAPGSIANEQLNNLENRYGDPPPASVLTRESPTISAISAPVLLLQGTADHHVAWQTVQQFYQAMKASGKAVKLVLYPGGHHGLHHANGPASTAAMQTWFQQHGLPSFHL